MSVSPVNSGSPERPRRVSTGMILLALALFGIALYLLVAVVTSRTVAKNTTVGGVSIGGMSTGEARGALRDRAQAQEALTVKVNDKSFTLNASEAGIALDADASVAPLTGFTLNPARLWAHVVGGGEHPAVVTADSAKFSSAVRKASTSIVSYPVEPKVTFHGAKVEVKEGKSGTLIKGATLLADIRRTWPGNSNVTGVAADRTPSVTKEEIDTFVKEKADPVVSAPVTITDGKKSFSLSPKEYISGIGIKAEKGHLSLSFNKEKLAKAIQARGKEAGVFVAAKDASVTLSGGSFSLVPAVTGTTVDVKNVSKPMQAAVLATGKDRVVKVSTTEVKPAVSTAKVRETMPTGMISSFTTVMPFNPGRTANIARAANTINGTYVAPGKTFSLNAALGQRTVAGGYNEAPVILNGRLTKQPGGGISQLSTTLFNAIFFAGAQIDEFHPHSFYISRYPKGREATISWPDVDNRFTNNTKGGILIQAYVSGANVTVTFFGRKTWDVEAISGPERNATKPKKITDDRPGCVPQSPSNGFDITTTRIFRQNGAEVKRQSFNVHYIPEDEVDCTHPDAG